MMRQRKAPSLFGSIEMIDRRIAAWRSSGFPDIDNAM
jgi:hypothetical protein